MARVRGARPRAWFGTWLKRVAERAGIEIRRHRAPGDRRSRLLVEHQIELVIDVGANRGQYGQELRRHGYRGLIASFEPLSEAYAELQRRASRDRRWSVHRLALSDVEPTLELGASDEFGSALPAGQRLVTLFPEAAAQTHESVPAARLDELELELPEGTRTLLKLDVQGYELRVLAGASGILHRVGIIETELSITPLYEGQPVLADTVRELDEAGFGLVALDPILRDWRTGEELQFDGVFVRRT
jgi:FkbM family methyltransferase